jgi:SAM-dependent methyltransferase
MAVYFGQGTDSEEGKRVFNYITQNSRISPEVAKRPSDADPFQLIYRFEKPDTAIDEYYVRSQSATAIHLRMVAMEDNLPGIIRREMNRQNLGPEEKFLILDVGSGPGDAIRKALRKNHHQDLLDKVEVHCVDPDERSIERGRELVDRDGLAENIKFFCQDMVNYTIEQQPKANLLLVIGMLCPMPNKTCLKILQNLHACAADSACIIYSTVQEEMIYEDPFLDVFMRVLGWHMHFKKEKEPQLIGQLSGWEPFSNFHDLLGYNRMTIGYK